MHRHWINGAFSSGQGWISSGRADGVSAVNGDRYVPLKGLTLPCIHVAAGRLQAKAGGEDDAAVPACMPVRSSCVQVHTRTLAC